MHHSTSTTGGLRRALGTALTAGVLVALAPVATASAQLGEPEVNRPVRDQWDWEDGPMFELDDPCSDNGPGGDASENCDEYDDDEDDDEDDEDDEEPEHDVEWGGPGLRVAEGRDRDMDTAQDEAEAEADDVCHGDWDLRDFEWDINPGSASVYTLTYECD